MCDHLSFGIEASTGSLLPQSVPSQVLDTVDQDSDEIQNRTDKHLGAAVDDPNDLAQAGWAVLFPGGKDCGALKQALKPLLDIRQTDAGKRFKIFEGDEGYQPGDTAETWLKRMRCSLREVDPSAGVPYYVMIVASPDEIPYEFQYRLDSYWAVGRLHFTNPAEFAQYATKAKAADKTKSPRTVAVVATRHQGDAATQLLHDIVASPFVKGVDDDHPILGSNRGFKMQPLLAADATKQNILNLLGGKSATERPSLVFSGTHGVRFAIDDPNQSVRQGALLCADYPQVGVPADPPHYLAESDLDGYAFDGLIHFGFACYSAGSPANDTYDRLANGDPKPLMKSPIVARLPQGLLARGALASVGHIDRAWTTSFMSGRTPQTQEFRSALDRILRGFRIGHALDTFNQRWSVLSGELSELLSNRQVPGQVTDDELLAKWQARNDARNYVVFGDPAARLNL